MAASKDELGGLNQNRDVVNSSSNLRPSSRRADIQGLRAIAVMVVVMFHAGLGLQGGFVGVDIFFVISGFVITAMLAREWDQSGRINFGQFYLRRFRRLTPALALMIAVTTVISAVVISPLGPQQTVAETAIGAMLFVANIVIAATTGNYFGTAADVNPLLHTWSLSVEEQFYLFFPALLAVGWVMSRRRRMRFGALIVVGSVAAISFLIAFMGPLDRPIAGFSVPMSRLAFGFYSPLTRAWEFAVGALLVLALRIWNLHLSRRTSGILGSSGMALLVLSLTVISSHSQYPGLWTLLPVCATLMLLLAGSEST